MTQPAAPGFQGLLQGIGANPYPFFAQLRRSAPVTQLGATGLWAVARYADCVRVLRDPDTFSSVVGVRQLTGELPPSLLFSDPPVHTRLRSLVAKAFTPRMVELQRPAIESYSEKLVDAMLESDEADVVAALAYPLPVQVIATMLGVADGDLATFKRWSDDIIENVGYVLLTGDDSVVAETNRQLDAYFSARIEKLRREPESNLLSELVHVETEEGKLTMEELLMFARLLLVAGNETTTGLIVNAIRAFAEFPHVYERVRSEPGLLRTAMEEALRYYAPFPATIRRAVRDAEVGGVTIPANARVLVLLGSANRDEAEFAQPDEFIPDREPNRHLSFGMGIHYCLGAPLARLEANVALSKLLPRVRRFELIDDPAMSVRPGGPKSFRVRFHRT